MAGGADDKSRDLDRTPTWAVAVVCAVMIIISLLLEKGLHRVGEWLTEKRQKALYEALEKIKAELMILGFISLLLTIGQNQIVKICIREEIANTMLPCPMENNTNSDVSGAGNRKRLLWKEVMNQNAERRFLAADSVASCPTGKVPLMSTNGLHQLHILVFFLAVAQVANSIQTMALGKLKIRRWKEWEKETASVDYEFSNDPSRFRFANEISFVRQHASIWNRITILVYIVSFFRQFFRSVRKTDYLTLRHGFISAHLAPGSKFNFQAYIKRSLEDDFKIVVGISPILWATAVTVLLLDVHAWDELFWTSLLPLIIILAVGTKLQGIISKMALQIRERHSVVQGIPVVKLSDEYFWFGRPDFVLFLIHFSLFQYSFGLKSCFHKKFDFVIARMGIGLGIQILCCYVTLPLYALVSQMGSRMKTSIFDEHTSRALKKWHEAAKKKHKKGSSSSTPGRSPSESPFSTPGQTPVHHLHRHTTIGHSGEAIQRSTRRHFSDHGDSDSDSEAEMNVPVSISNSLQEEPLQSDVPNPGDDFSFAKPSAAADQSKSQR